MADIKAMSSAQRAYEAKRAAKAGKSLEAWLSDKQKRQEAEAKAASPTPAPAPKKQGLIGRLIDRAHKPL